jgi:hypothetical protein
LALARTRLTPPNLPAGRQGQSRMKDNLFTSPYHHFWDTFGVSFYLILGLLKLTISVQPFFDGTKCIYRVEWRTILAMPGYNSYKENFAR